MKTFLVGYPNDKAAIVALTSAHDAIERAEGHAHFSLSFGNGPAFLVVSLPDGVDVATVLPNGSPKAVPVGEMAEKIAEVLQTPEPEQSNVEEDEFDGEFEE